MKQIVREKYVSNPSRNGRGLDVFIDFPRHVLHMKNEETPGQYFLMYFSDIEKKAFREACQSDNIITMYDNSYFEYKIEGTLPSMTKYADDIRNYKPDIIMADVNAAEYKKYKDTLIRSALYTLCIPEQDTLFMAIPHGDSLEEMCDVISSMNNDECIDIIGIPYIFDGFTRIDIIAHCIATGRWCWNKPVHLLGLADANEIQSHKDLIRICQNIISIDTSYPVLLGCNGETLRSDPFNNDVFFNSKPSFNIVNCPTEKTDESIIRENIGLFKEVMQKATSGFATIAIVGAAGTGKTTIALKINELLGERSVYLKYPPLHVACDYRDPAMADLATALYTGCNIMAANVPYEKTVLLDRCVIDNIVYAKSNKNYMQVLVFIDIYKKFCLHNMISSVAWALPLEGAIEEDGKRVTDKNVQSQINDYFEEVILDLAPTAVILNGDLSVDDRIEYLLRHI